MFSIASAWLSLRRAKKPPVLSDYERLKAHERRKALADFDRVCRGEPK